MSDDQYRKSSIPYLGQIFGYNRNEKSDQDISQARALGDLANLGNAGGFVPQKDNYIRILRPQRSELVAAYLNVSLRTATTEPNPQLRITVTKTTSETNLTVVPLTDAEILQKHRTLRGSDSPFSNSAGQLISVFKLDLMALVPKFGSPDFRSDCFVLGLHFPTQPVASGFKIYKLEVNGSALIVRN